MAIFALDKSCNANYLEMGRDRDGAWIRWGMDRVGPGSNGSSGGLDRVRLQSFQPVCRRHLLIIVSGGFVGAEARAVNLFWVF